MKIRITLEQCVKLPSANREGSADMLTMVSKSILTSKAHKTEFLL